MDGLQDRLLLAHMGRTRQIDAEAVIATATSVFARLGYEATSFSELEASTGLLSRSLRLAYGSKEELYQHTLDYWYEWWQRQFPDDDRGIMALERFFVRVIEVSARDRKTYAGCPILMSAATLPELNRKTRTKVLRVMGLIGGFVREHCEHAAAAGELGSGLQADSAAAAIEVAWVGLRMAGLQGAAAADLKRLAAGTFAAVRRVSDNAGD